jgi:hypothetical protein
MLSISLPYLTLFRTAFHTLACRNLRVMRDLREPCSLSYSRHARR